MPFETIPQLAHLGLGFSTCADVILLLCLILMKIDLDVEALDLSLMYVNAPRLENPLMIAFVVAMAGIIFPAICLISNFVLIGMLKT